MKHAVSAWERLFRRVSAQDVAAELSIFESSTDRYLSPQGAAKVLSFYAGDPSAISFRAIGRLLSYDEAAIRAKAIELWLKLPREDDEESPPTDLW